MSARTRDDWILWGSVGCALVGTAHSEWSLAVAAGAHPWVAVVVPGALDLYVLRALRVHRDVFLAVLAMVAANVSWYLVHSGDLPVDWPLRSAVGALAPLVLWRVHSLKYTRTRKELPWGTPAGAVSAPAGHAPDTVPAASTPVPVAGQSLATAPAWAPGYHPDGCDGQHKGDSPLACTHRASALGYAAPDHVPDEWMADEYPETYPGTAVLAAQEDEYADKWVPSAGAPVAHLHPVPALPDEYAPGTAVHSAELEERDREYAVPAREYVAECAVSGTVPSVRGIRRSLKVGQDRGERLLAWLESEET